METAELLENMRRVYLDDPVRAVRGQLFIKQLHDYLADQLELRLTPWARRRGIKVVKEAKIFGSHKTKDVDVAVIDPTNGPLVIIGVRSQMSSVGKNILTYYQDIVGESISLQDRFPMATYGYAYLHPLKAIKEGSEVELINHKRYARLYEAISGRDGRAYASLRGFYDEFAYIVVDFLANPPSIRDDIVQQSVRSVDLSLETLVDRLLDKAVSRSPWLEVFSSDLD